jgi:phospholipid/cholesterol/gamma-HCH transport system ATP-binding protein
MQAAVELVDVNCTRDGYRILDKVSIVFPPGECTVIMGFSGSGKSYLLKIAAGLAIPEEGQVLMDGLEFSHMSDRDLLAFRKKCGFVFQDAALWANLTVFQNLALPLQFHNPDMKAADVEARVKAVARTLEFRENLQLRPAMLSSGERKIASFLRGLTLDPDLLYIDDPTVSVDTSTADRMLQVLKELKQRGKTLIITTHNAKFTSQLADQLIILKAGRIIDSGHFKTVTRSTDREVVEILSEVLGQTATYDQDLLNLLGDNP